MGHELPALLVVPSPPNPVAIDWQSPTDIQNVEVENCEDTVRPSR